MSKYPLQKTDKEWRELLNEKEYKILRQQGTEEPHTGKYNQHFEKGIYRCKGCDEPLYKSEHKFKSDCGWPSYSEAIKDALIYKKRYECWNDKNRNYLCKMRRTSRTRLQR